MIQDRTEELAQLHFEHAPREERSSNGRKLPPPGTSSKPDEEVIEKVRFAQSVTGSSRGSGAATSPTTEATTAARTTVLFISCGPIRRTRSR